MSIKIVRIKSIDFIRPSIFESIPSLLRAELRTGGTPRVSVSGGITQGFIEVGREQRIV